MPKINPWRFFKIPKKDKSITDYYAMIKEVPLIKPCKRGMHRDRTTRFIGAIPEMAND